MLTVKGNMSTYTAGLVDSKSPIMCNLNSYFPILAPHLSTISPMDHGMQSKSSHASTDSLEIKKHQAPSSMLPSPAACKMSGTRLRGDSWATSDPGNKLQIRASSQPFKNEHTIFWGERKAKSLQWTKVYKHSQRSTNYVKTSCIPFSQRKKHGKNKR